MPGEGLAAGSLRKNEATAVTTLKLKQQSMILRLNLHNKKLNCLYRSIIPDVVKHREIHKASGGRDTL